MNNNLNQINEFGIKFSTVNGSGSATANSTILKAIFNMGILVSGRNIFPSNIQGMPTWYSMRVSGKEEVIDNDVKRMSSGGILLVDTTIAVPEISKECCVFRMPIEQILNECKVPAHLKIYLANMVYVGILAELINIEVDKIELVINKHFKNRKNAIEPNMHVVMQSYE